MIFRPLILPGAFEIQPEPRGDERGFFARIFCDREFADHGLNTRWAQINISFSRSAGTLRGLHFQRPPAAEVKLVRCLRGRALDVIVDLRANSETYGKHLMLELNPSSGNAIYVPKGFAHGFQTLEPDTELQYFHSDPYQPDLEGGVDPLDPALAIAWPRPPRNLSARDRALPPFDKLVPL